MTPGCGFQKKAVQSPLAIAGSAGTVERPVPPRHCRCVKRYRRPGFPNLKLGKAMGCKTILGFLLTVATVSIAGCGPRTDSRLVAAHLIDHFRKNGLNGRYRRLNAKSIGAEDGGRYSSREQGFLLEFAKFDDPKKAKRFANKGFRPKNSDRVYPCYANGVFVMIVRRKPEKKNVVKIFQSF
jgi:hypothetical protein